MTCTDFTEKRFLADPPALMRDEATSVLDAAVEAQVEDALPRGHEVANPSVDYATRGEATQGVPGGRSEWC